LIREIKFKILFYTIFLLAKIKNMPWRAANVKGLLFFDKLESFDRKAGKRESTLDGWLI
jgi:hypothetical protein